ncbi:hypothetical protein BDR06DRAFT_224200 [Suillus hirtellus]|nr:hypothetical protein BDR06DRAFT_224200 [Suillus hirtellus]
MVCCRLQRRRSVSKVCLRPACGRWQSMPGRKLEAKKVERKKAADTVYFVTDEGMMNRASTKCMPWHGLYTT